MSDSTIRIKQVNQSELSGFVSPMIQSGMAATGQFTDVFYPRNSNPLGYITSGQTGVFKTQEDLDTLYYATLSYVSSNFYPSSNPSNYLSATNCQFFLTTGNQIISGFPTFASGINLNNFLYNQGALIANFDNLNSSLSLGINSYFTSGIEGALALGYGAKVIGGLSTAIGYGAYASGAASTAVGYSSYSSSDNSFVIGADETSPYGAQITYVGINISSPTCALDVKGRGHFSNGLVVENLFALSGNAPITSHSSGIKGQIAVSGIYLFVATGNNQWGRVALSTF